MARFGVPGQRWRGIERSQTGSVWGYGVFLKSSFAPLGLVFLYRSYPRLTLWAAFFRRFTAGYIEG